MPPRYGELLFIAALGLLQPFVEMSAGKRIAAYYNLLAALLVLSYVLVCLCRYPGILRVWGFRLDTLLPSLRAHLSFALPAGALIYAYGWQKGSMPLPSSFWYLLALYPLWGLAQQFALQNMVAQNLTKLVPHLGLRALICAAAFGSVHLPSLELAALASCAGFFFTYIYHSYPNLLAVGFAHGIVGVLAFYVVLGNDQWEVLMRYLGA